MERGLLHIYFGEGKGKTTASIGLAVRCAGVGGKVLFVQFLKSDISGENRVLDGIENITVLPPPDNVKFSFKMSQSEKAEAREYYTRRFGTACDMAKSYDMLVLDELMHAINAGFVQLDAVLSFLRERSCKTEIVITGRAPIPELFEEADYITEMKKIKHPFDKGVKARKGVEY